MATFQTPGYPQPPPPPPPGYGTYAYRTPPHTPPPTAGAYAYYSPRNYVYTPPTKGHARRATGDGATYTYTYHTTPHSKPARYTTPDHTYYTSAQSTPQRKSDYVSASDQKRAHARYEQYRAPADTKRRTADVSSEYYAASSRSHYVSGDDYYERSYDELPRYEKTEPRPPPYKSQHKTFRYEARTDHRSRDQVPIYEPADTTPKPSTRPRRSSFTTTKPSHPPPRARPTTAQAKPAARATEEDARRAGIPAGYSYKNWDPTEEPILLLGSVFDANSLGKWIYDWTVFFFGTATPMTEVAGELWLLLIQLAHKVKRAEEIMPRIRSQSSRDLVDDFLESGERLWQRFNKLLKICENYMWKAAKKECGNAKHVQMGKNAGCEFVDAIFGRDRELERTEKLMTGMRLWSMRFDANCEDILRNPAA